MRLCLGADLHEAGSRTAHVYFPTEGFISLLASKSTTPGLEIALVGVEGMLGAQLALGVNTSPLHAMVQGEGTAWRMSAAAFVRHLRTNPKLDQVLRRYVYVLLAQFATAAPCVRFHAIVPRLARWLLMSHDRAGTDCFRATHEFLAYMLGVRRAGVTEAAGALQKQGLIRYERGEMVISDRAGLEAAACACYAADCSVHADVMTAGVARPRQPPGAATPA